MFKCKHGILHLDVLQSTCLPSRLSACFEGFFVYFYFKVEVKHKIEKQMQGLQFTSSQLKKKRATGIL